MEEEEKRSIKDLKEIIWMVGGEKLVEIRMREERRKIENFVEISWEKKYKERRV